jgi:16S rRNA (adenine1518-N6/adenine1519-N6)-dimethyltransferase
VTRLGQNFLNCEIISRKIVNNLEVQNSDYVFQIGPGKGILTKYFLNRIIVCEIDTKLCKFLSERFGSKVQILNIDFRKLQDFKNCKYIIGSIPFYITKSVFQKLIEQHNKWKVCILILQIQVINKILDIKQSRLKFIISNFFNFVYLGLIPSKKFKPEPKVDAGIIKLVCKKPVYPNCFLNFMKNIFKYNRKKLSSILKLYNFNLKLNLNSELLDLRPQDLNSDRLQELYQLYISSKI